MNGMSTVEEVFKGYKAYFRMIPISFENINWTDQSSVDVYLAKKLLKFSKLAMKDPPGAITVLTSQLGNFTHELSELRDQELREFLFYKERKEHLIPSKEPEFFNGGDSSPALSQLRLKDFLWKLHSLEFSLRTTKFRDRVELRGIGDQIQSPLRGSSPHAYPFYFFLFLI
ncbi:hypothetical protein Tco_0040135 [Tanacetum coccineum]